MTEEQKYENRLRIGGQVAAIRKEKGLTIRELADRCGVSFQNITKIENGKYNVSIDILGKICNAFDYEIRIHPKNGWWASHNDFETPDVIKINLDNPSEAIEILKSYMQAVK
jgi:transcriptional regulator with XRE-family HTH domain